MIGFVGGLTMMPGYRPDKLRLEYTQFDALPFEDYWKSDCAVPTPTTRGFQMIQTFYPHTVEGAGSDTVGDWVVWSATLG